MALQLSDFFLPDRLFVANPGVIADPALFRVMLWTGVVLAVVGFIAKVGLFFTHIPSVKKKPWRQIAEWMLSGGVLWLLWLFFRRESVAYLSSRVLILAIAIGYLVWLGWILFHIFFRYPAALREYDDMQRKKKYLPQRKD